MKRAALLALLLGSALAVRPAVTPALLQAAAAEGERLAAAPEAGYPLRPYTVYAVPDTLKLVAANGSVDAVTIATPFERTRYEVFLHRLGEDPVTPAGARAQAGLPDHQVAFIVFAHGRTPDDQAFLSQFSAARLTLGGQRAPLLGTARSGASISQYPRTEGEIGLRFIGTVTYRFRLPAGLENASGTLSFTDATGKAFTLPVRLARYR
ncbi:hypothetical protein [Deinococcus actinosclerus]|uniref:Uncharacterized protein n=1 Tax=Deinococcus actinosclerus TaxID=1768108 RepID=A0ABN4K3G5_9DEIO|nr:hypothetical protein [Deinococcus actinosclerus]ALW87650.1 hypothetical protein AUC44_01020 [Deinococcus actinosclerus]